MDNILETIQRRRDAGEDPCDSCNATGGGFNEVCVDCLGQGVLLTREEFRAILELAGHIPVEDDSILDQDLFED